MLFKDLFFASVAHDSQMKLTLCRFPFKRITSFNFSMFKGDVHDRCSGKTQDWASYPTVFSDLSSLFVAAAILTTLLSLIIFFAR